MGSGYLDLGLRVSGPNEGGVRIILKAWAIENPSNTASTLRPSSMEPKNTIPKLQTLKPSMGARKERRPRSAPHLHSLGFGAQGLGKEDLGPLGLRV